MTSPSTAMSNLASNLVHQADKFRHLYLSSSALDSPSADSSDFVALLSAIRSNHFIEKVYFRNLKDDDAQMSQLLLATADAASLQGMYFHCTHVPVAALAEALRSTGVNTRQHQLTGLGLRHVTLKGTPAEIQDFCQAVSQHASLQHVCLECCDWSDSSIHHAELEQVTAFGYSCTHVFLQALSCLSSLTQVELVLVPPPPQSLLFSTLTNHTQHNLLQIQLHLHQQWSRNFLHALAPKLPFLTSLRLRHLALGDQEIAFLTRGFQNHQQHTSDNNDKININDKHHGCPLTILRISCDLTPLATAHLSSWLAHPNNRLVQLALRVDRPLKDPNGPQALARALLTNTSLRQLHLSGHALVGMSESAKEAFVELLETNVHLDQVRLDVQDYTHQSKLAFYLTLNPRGRREVLSSAGDVSSTGNRDVWVDALFRNRHDGAALYYFVRLHPGLYAHAALEHQDDERELPTQQQRYQEQQWLLDTTGIEFDDDYRQQE